MYMYIYSIVLGLYIYIILYIYIYIYMYICSVVSEGFLVPHEGRYMSIPCRHTYIAYILETYK